MMTTMTGHRTKTGRKPGRPRERFYDPVKVTYDVHPKVRARLRELSAERGIPQHALLAQWVAAESGTTVSELTAPDPEEVLPATGT